jgi:hypothetical protein
VFFDALHNNAGRCPPSRTALDMQSRALDDACTKTDRAESGIPSIFLIPNICTIRLARASTLVFAAPDRTRSTLFHHNLPDTN